MNGDAILVQVGMFGVTTPEPTMAAAGSESLTAGWTNQTSTTAAAPGLQPPYWEPHLVVILTVILSVVMVVSVVGNSLVILTMVFFKGMRSKTHLFIANLACADLGVSLLCMPVSMATVVLGDWAFGQALCTLNAFLEALFLVASTHGLMIIALHKFFSLVMPLRRVVNHRRAVAMVAFAWFVGLTCAMWPILGFSENVYKPGTSQCGPKYPETLSEKITGFYVPLVGIIIPLVCLIVAYSVIFHTILKYSSRLRDHTSMTEDRIFQQQKRITITLFIVFVAFLLCWTPYFVYSCMGFAISFERVPTILNVVAYWSGYTNSALNPIIYAWRAKSYRQAFRKICCCTVQSGYIIDTATAHNGEFVSPYLPRRRHAIKHRTHPPSKSSNQSSALKLPPVPSASPATRPVGNGRTRGNGWSPRPDHRDISSDEDDEVFLPDGPRRKSETDKECLEQRHFDSLRQFRNRTCCHSEPVSRPAKTLVTEEQSPWGFARPNWKPDRKAQRAIYGRSTLV